MNNQIDVVIPARKKDLCTLELCIEGVKKNVCNIGRVIVVSKEKLTNNAEWVREASFPFTLEDVKNKLAKPKKDYTNAHWMPREGWYYQQLLKLYFFFVIPNLSLNILEVDADVIFLNKVRFTEDETALYAWGTENHLPYFRHMQRLLPQLGKAIKDKSGICHHLLYQHDLIYDLFFLVEEYHKLPFWEAFLYCVDVNDDYKSGAGENEMYFSFINKFHIHRIKLRKLKWQNHGDLSRLEEFKKEGFDFIAFHWIMRDRYNKMKANLLIKNNKK